MNLATLKSKLSTLTGTQISQVYFDWSEFKSTTRNKTYPIIFWVIDGMSFEGDMRSSTIQQIEDLTLTVFAISHYDPQTEDKITVWDTLKGYFKTYLNAMNNTDGIQILNIDDIKGEYVPERLISADSELGIMVRDIKIRTFCNV